MAFKPFVFPSVRTKFQPKVGDTYRFIGVPGSVRGNLSLKIGRRVWAGNKADKARMAVGNVYRDISKAKQVRQAIVDVLVNSHK